MSEEKEKEWQEKAWNDALYGCPDDILQAEVERRQSKKRLDEIPKLQVYPEPDDPIRPLMDLCYSYISQLAEEEPYDDEKVKDYIFEAAIECFFGKDVWIWIKKRLE